MALFDNVTYTFYSTTLGRSEVPNETEFDKYKLENELFVKRLYNDGFLFERETNGIDSAVCMMIEADYHAAQIAAGETAPVSNESIGGYSYSGSSKEYDMYIDKNAKTTEAIKYKWLGLYCDITSGVR